MAADQAFFVQDPVKECPAQKDADRGILAVLLAYEGINYGVMLLFTPRKMAMDEAEKTIIEEVADDIAVGLYRLYLEKKREGTERAAQRSRVRFTILIENSLNFISIIQNHSTVYKNPGLRTDIPHSLETIFLI